MTFTPTKEQDEALDTIFQWYNEGGMTLTMGGYAGTGKTTILGVLPEHLSGIRMVYVSYTGKAVSVLRGKLPRGSECSTIHRLLYHPRKELLCIESGEPVPFIGGYCSEHHDNPRIEPDTELPVPCETKSHLNWSLVQNPLDGIDLVVVDEASMVSEKLWQDLTRWDVPVLAVGDHGQLPPIRSEFNLMANPHIKLEKILRQAADSPIIQMATQARTEGRIKPGDYGQGCMKIPQHQLYRVPLNPNNGDLAIVGFNRTRNELNEFYRRKNGRKGDPTVGDVVICLRNNYEAGVFNGMRGTVVDYETMPYGDRAFAEIALMDEEFEYTGEISSEQFGKPKTLSDTPRRFGLFDFGYAMTCHKAQGSQANRVLVVEERMPRADNEMHARWLYTAATRAAKELVIVGR